MPFIHYPSRRFQQLAQCSRETPEEIQRDVAKILKQVKAGGDSALLRLTRKFDRVRLTPQTLKVSLKDLRSARVNSNLRKAAQQTLRSVESFARASLPLSWSHHNVHGARVGEKFDPIERVGIYIPGGSVPLVSTIFMTVALARVAGVSQIVVCSPPPIASEILWALPYCGATEVYRLGGAQAMAAMAYGTRSIRAVDKIFGPGNAYVTEAKRQLFGVVGIDLLAGPSELMVLADRTTRFDWAAADLLAQAEHGSGRERIYCVSQDAAVLKKIYTQLTTQSQPYLKNRGLCKVLKEGTWFIKVRNPKELSAVANLLAPEHLQIMTSNSNALAKQITTAGGIFLGNHTPTVLGDFVAGPSHTLPTGGAGRFFSGLRAADFMRRTSLVRYDPKAISRAFGTTDFARVEHLPLHGLSYSVRGAKKSW